MIVRLLRPWKYRKVGTVLNEVPDGTANVLIRRGVAEPVKPADKPERGKRERNLLPRN